MRGSRGSYTPRGGGVATSQQAASGLVISNVSEQDKHEDDEHEDDDHHEDEMNMNIMEALLQVNRQSVVLTFLMLVIIMIIMMQRSDEQ